MSFAPDTRYEEGDIRRWLRPDERRALVALCCEDLDTKITVRSTVPLLSKFPKAQRNDPRIITVREQAEKRASDLMNDRFQSHGAGNIVRLIWRLAAEREAAAGGKIFEAYADGDDPLSLVGPDPTPEPA